VFTLKEAGFAVAFAAGAETDLAGPVAQTEVLRAPAAASMIKVFITKEFKKVVRTE
jgi:hypothetical protein